MVLVIKNKDSVLKKKNLFFYYNFFKHQKKMSTTTDYGTSISQQPLTYGWDKSGMTVNNTIYWDSPKNALMVQFQQNKNGQGYWEDASNPDSTVENANFGMFAIILYWPVGSSQSTDSSKGEGPMHIYFNPSDPATYTGVTFYPWANPSSAQTNAALYNPGNPQQQFDSHDSVIGTNGGVNIWLSYDENAEEWTFGTGTTVGQNELFQFLNPTSFVDEPITDGTLAYIQPLAPTSSNGTTSDSVIVNPPLLTMYTSSTSSLSIGKIAVFSLIGIAILALGGIGIYFLVQYIKKRKSGGSGSETTRFYDFYF